MASNTPMNYTNMPMGSHATAGGPHQPLGMPSGMVSIQGSSQFPTPGTHHGMPSTQTASPQVPIQQMPMQQIPVQQFPMAQPVIPNIQGIPLSSFQQLTGTAPVDFDVLGTTPVMDTEYTQGYLRSQIGKKVEVDFLIGTDSFLDKQGILVDVGISYILINETDTDDLVLCDIYSIKFVRFYQ